MKKIVVMLLAFVMLLSLCACGAKEEPVEDVQINVQPKVEATTAVTDAPTEAPTEASTEPAVTEAAAPDKKALAESCIDKDISELYALIGEPASSEYAPSCLVDGEDGVLYYDGFVVYTTREGEVETVYYVE